MSEQCILLGHPVEHSVSPAIHRAAYELLGLQATYRLCDAPSEMDVRHWVQRIRIGQVRGANVTVPWKQVALAEADRQDKSAAQVFAANVLALDDDGQVVAYNTDAWALADELRQKREDAGGLLENRAGALVVGSGGAAYAAVAACRAAGFAPVYVTARRFDPSEPETRWPGAQQFSALGGQLKSWPGFRESVIEELAPELGAIVQATSAGMKGTQGGEELVRTLRLDALHPSIAYDLVYNPSVTPFVARAWELGHSASSGLGMLVGQAAHAIEIWFGVRPPPAPLLEAAREALSL